MRVEVVSRPVPRIGACLTLLCLLAGSFVAPPAYAAASKLHWIPRPNGLPAVSVEASDSEVVELQSSPDLSGWTEWLRVHGSVSGLADLREGEVPHRFYRARTRPRAGNDDWKNVVSAGPEEPFQSEPPNPWDPALRWIKFALLLDAPHRVYFQDSARYLFHYDFAVARLPGFAGMKRQEFDAVTLRTNGMRAVLGAVLLPPSANLAEVGVQIVGQDPFPREQVAAWIESVRAMIQVPEGTRVLYLPTLEQAPVAQENAAWFEQRGIPVGSAARWVTGDECYASGWALGRLHYVASSGITAAYRDGSLKPDDILLLDAVPAEVPPVAGIISLSPATPNSHVALLAQSFGIPFIHVVRPGIDAELRSWEGREVMIRAIPQFQGCDVTLAAMDGPLSPSMREEILALKAAPDLELTPKASRGVVSLAVDPLGPPDIRYVGGKAANLGILRRSIPESSPDPAIAFTFDLWDGYLAQPFRGGTLGGAIAQRLGGFQWPPDMAALGTALDEIRDWIRNDTDFNAAQRTAVLEALQAAGFDPMRKIRFRSSTNVEDSEQFSGAGLYDSYSGCLMDDLDGDNTGPSHCDPAEANERGVFRALRRVYASFYNANAYLERLRHRVDESIVGMAVLVHVSTPDEFELANGVATFTVLRSGDSRAVNATLVTQVGAESVSNPDTAAQPETVSASQFGNGGPFLEVKRRSSRVPLGDSVLGWPKEYEALFALLDRAAQRWESELPRREAWTLDFEYKKEAPEGVLRVKQIRSIPQPPEEPETVPWLLNAAHPWVVLQGEFGDLLAMHRLKSEWSFSTPHRRLDPKQIPASLFDGIRGHWLEGTNQVTREGPPTSLPGHRVVRTEDAIEDHWTASDGGRSLRVELSTFVGLGAGPLRLLSDLRIQWQASYDTPQPTPEFLEGGRVSTRLVKDEVVHLVPVRPVTLESKRQLREFRLGARQVRTEFYWPPEPKGIVAGYTAPLQAWLGTTLTGFTSRPIELRSDAAQTYHPGHHNFWEEFLFDPWLEPGMDPAILEELTQANIRALIVVGDRDTATTTAVWGLDGTFRMLN